MLSNVQRGGARFCVCAGLLLWVGLHGAPPTQQQGGDALLKANVEASLVSADMSDRLKLVAQFSGSFSLESDAVSKDPNLFIPPPP